MTRPPTQQEQGTCERPAAGGGEVVAFIHKDDLDDLRSGRDRKDAPVFSSLAAVSEEFRGGMIPLYTAPPAAVPADALERLAASMESAWRPNCCCSDTAKSCADELAALIPKGAV